MDNKSQKDNQLKMKMDYLCPQCLCGLRLENNIYSCGNCNSNWQVKEEIPVFLNKKKPLYFMHDHKKALELIEIARNNGWQEAVSRSKAPDFAGRFGGFYSKDKIGWIDLINLSPEAKILDIGCGWGGLSFELSKRYAEVSAMDITYERCLFNLLRAKQEGIGNINIFCAGNMHNLPLNGNYFDLSFFNGSLEWIPLSQEGDPLLIQMQTLKEAHRVLKNGGSLYIGMENRFGLNYLLGDPDPHTKLRFANVFPRVLADFYSRSMQGRPFRTYTHSFSGWRRILSICGFEQIKFFWPIPDYRKFTRILPLDDGFLLKKELELQRKYSGFKGSLLLGAKQVLVDMGVYKQLVPSFGITARAKK